MIAIDCDSIVKHNWKLIEYYPGFAVRLSNVIESIEYYGKFQFNQFDYVPLGNPIQFWNLTVRTIYFQIKRLDFHTNSNWLIHNYLRIQPSQSKRQSNEPIKCRKSIERNLTQNLNRMQSNITQKLAVRLRFDCVRTLSLANQRWWQEILLIADLILRDLLYFKIPTKFTTDRPTDRSTDRLNLKMFYDANGIYFRLPPWFDCDFRLIAFDWQHRLDLCNL